MKIDVSAYELNDPADEHAFERLVGPAGKWRETRDTQIGILERLGLAPHHRFMDGGCGSLRAGLPLIGYLDRGNYHGVDIDAQGIAAARALVDRFGLAEAKAPRIVHSRTFGLEELGGGEGMDVIWSYQVFIHLSAAHTRQALKSIAHLLKPQGAAYITIKTHGAAEGLRQVGEWRSYPITAARPEVYAELAAAEGLEAEVLGTLGDFGLPAARAGSVNLLVKLVRQEAANV